MTFTQEDMRDKIRSQLIYELKDAETPKETPNKSRCGLSKKAKFLSNPRKSKQKGEIPI